MMKNVYCFSGNEYFIKMKVQAWKKSFLAKHENDLNIVEFWYEKQDDLSLISQEIESFPFLSPYKLIFIYQFLDAKEKNTSAENNIFDKIYEVCEKAPDSSIVVFCSEDPDKRTLLYKNIIQKNRKHFTVEKNAMLSGFDESGKVVPLADFFYKQFEEKIPRSLIEYVILLILPPKGNVESKEIFTLYNELSKLENYVLDHELSREVIDKMIPAGSFSKVFDLTDAIGFGQVQKAILIFEELIAMQEDLHGILAVLISHVRKLIVIKSFLTEKKPKSVMAEYLGNAAFTLEKLVKQVSYFSSTDILHLYQMLLETDRSLKQGEITVSSGQDTSFFALQLEKFIVHASSRGK